MPPKLTIEHVREKFQEEGYTLLEEKYVNADSHLRYTCNNNHTTKITWNKFRKGQRCRSCNGSEKLTLEYVQEQFFLRGYELLTKEYINNGTLMNCKCPEGHIISTSWGNLQRDDHQCIVCNDYYITIFQVYEEFKERGFKLKTTEYKNNKEKLKYVCYNGHNSKIDYKSFKEGSGCKQCATDKSKHSLEYIKNKFQERGYTLTSTEYVSCDEKLQFTCSKGHETEISYSKLRRGRGCNCCFFKNEQKCREILEAYFNTKFPKRRPSWMNRLELDGYCEELGIAFEYNGEQHYEYNPFFHRGGLDDFNKIVSNDKLKLVYCKENKVTLLVIPHTVKFNDLEEYILAIIS